MGLFELFNKKNAADVSTLFTDENKVSISAADAYKKSRYGILKSDKMMLKEFFTDVKLMVEQKNMERSYCGMLQLDDDIIKFLPRIKDRLMRQLGFKVIILDDNSVITNKELKSEDTIKTGSTFVLLVWNKQALEDVEEMKTNNLLEPISDDSSIASETVDSIKDEKKKEVTPAISGNSNPMKKHLNS